MAPNIGQYNYPQYSQYPKYAQYNQQGNFNGDPAMSPMADKAVSSAQESPLGQLFPTTPEQWKALAPFLGIGAGISIASQQLINLACGKWTKDGKKSPLERLSEAIDGSSVGKKLTKFDKKVKSFFAGVKERTTDKIHIEASKPSFELAKGAVQGPKNSAREELIKRVKEFSNKKDISTYGTESEINDFLTSIHDEKLAPEKIYSKLKDNNVLKNIVNEDGELKLISSKVKNLEGAGGKSLLTRIIPKSFMQMGEVLTGGTIGGGALGIIMNAFCLGQSIQKASKAPKGQKLSTFMEDFWGNFVANMVLMPVIGKFFYEKVVGLRYTGIASEKELAEGITRKGKYVDKAKELTEKIGIRDGLKKLGNDSIDDKDLTKFVSQRFENAVTDNDFANYVAKKLGKEVKDIKGKTGKQLLEELNMKNLLKTEQTALKKLYRGNVKMFSPKWFAKKIGDLAGIGNKEALGQGIKRGGKISSLVKDIPLLNTIFSEEGVKELQTSIIPAITRRGKVWNKIKGVGGGTMRFVLIGMVLMQPISKLFMKASDAIFGKPTNSQLDEDKKKDENSDKNEPAKMNSQPPVQNDKKTASQVAQPTNLSQNAFLNSVKAQPQQSQAAQQLNTQNQQNQNQQNQTQNTTQQPVRTYIPQPTPVQVTSSTNISQAIDKSDKAVDYATRTLKDMGIQI